MSPAVVLRRPDRPTRPNDPSSPLTDPYAAPMPLGLGHGLIAALCWGSTDVMASFAGRRLGSLHVVALAQVTSVIIAILLAVSQGVGLPSDPGTLLLASVFGAIAAGAYLSFFTALRIGPLA